jgi:hypothetical protein
LSSVQREPFNWLRTVDERSAQIATICECIDQCVSFAMWCDDFAGYVDPEDMVNGLDRAFDLVSDATRRTASSLCESWTISSVG